MSSSEALRPDVVEHGVDGRAAGVLVRADGAGDGGQDLSRIGQGRELDQPGTVRPVGDRRGGDVEQQSRLAGAARADERHEAAVAHQPGDDVQLLLAADERGQRQAHVGLRAIDGVERGMVAGQAVDDEVGEPERFGEVLEAVTAEVAGHGAGRQVVLGQGERRLGQDHLPAMPGGGDPRGAVDVEADVAIGTDHAATGVQAHPDADRVTGRPR